MPAPIIIIGTGLAGYQFAREFRKLDNKTDLTIITADEGHFYSKPQLSTGLTKGKTSDTLITATTSQMGAELNATIITNSEISSINTQQKVVYTQEKSYPYSKLILCIGADVIKPALHGNAAQDILSINHLNHYATFRKLVNDQKVIAILGAGLIGCEFANDLSNAGYEVHVIAPSNAPLDLLIPEKMGIPLQKALEKNGVHFHFQCVATHINKIGKSYALTLSNGRELNVDFVLSAIGLKPHTTLAHSAGIKINRGIVVNRFLETSEKDIYALGDCAEVEGLVLPFIKPILNCAGVLAKTITGEKTAVAYPAMSISVKTPAYPIVISPPPKNSLGQWKIETHHNSTRALFYNSQQLLCGFILTNELVTERASLASALPKMF